jgi:AcrR family transcriptional regulator
LARQVARIPEKIDPRVRRTRELLRQALTELLAEKSFAAITVRDIAERATVNRATFYAHFPDKYGLLEYTIRQQIRQALHSQLGDGSSLSPKNLAALISAVCKFLVDMNRHCPPPHGQMEPLMEKQVKAELYELLLGWQARGSQGRPPRHPAAEQRAMVASWAIYGAAVHWGQQARRQALGEYVQAVLPLIQAGLQASAAPA